MSPDKSPGRSPGHLQGMDRKPKGAPTGGQFAASARTESGVDLSSPAPKRTVVPEPSWYGWAMGVKVVEVEVLQREVSGGYALQAVYADGTLIGHVVGRKASALKKRKFWDYVVGTERPNIRQLTGLVYSNDSRQIVLSNLTSAAKQARII